MTIQTARWIHGNAFEVEYPDRLVRQEHKGWGIKFVMKPGTSNWFHISLPTPVIIDGSRPQLSKFFILYRTSQTALPADGGIFGSQISSIHLYDGYHKLKEFKEKNGSYYFGNHLEKIDTLNTWELDTPSIVHSGLGISVCATCPKMFDEGYPVEFATVGADFIK